jgi:release factor glutamine methyltransferase
LICANLPYIPSDRLPGLAVSAQEPVAALDGGIQGMEVIERLIWECQPRLAEDGLLLLEIDHTQGTTVRDVAKKAFPGAEINLHQDLGGQDRLVSIQPARKVY